MNSQQTSKAAPVSRSTRFGMPCLSLQAAKQVRNPEPLVGYRKHLSLKATILDQAVPFQFLDDALPASFRTRIPFLGEVPAARLNDQPAHVLNPHQPARRIISCGNEQFLRLITQRRDGRCGRRYGRSRLLTCWIEADYRLGQLAGELVSELTQRIVGLDQPLIVALLLELL